MMRTFKKGWVELSHLVRFLCRAQYAIIPRLNLAEMLEFRFGLITIEEIVLE